MTGTMTEKQQPWPLRPRKVRFAPHERNHTIDRLRGGDMDAATFAQIWYSHEDHRAMKERSRYDAKKNGKGVHTLLRDTFQFPRPDAQACINAFCLQEDSISTRGLERFLSRNHYEERMAISEGAVRAVIVQQRSLLKKGTKPDEMAEKLSEVYSTIGRAARVFSRRMGVADELAAREGGEAQQAQQILQALHLKTVTGGNGTGQQRGLERRASGLSVQSGCSFDSRRRLVQPTPHPPRLRSSGGLMPRSPASKSPQFYASIA